MTSSGRGVHRDQGGCLCSHSHCSWVSYTAFADYQKGCSEGCTCLLARRRFGLRVHAFLIGTENVGGSPWSIESLISVAQPRCHGVTENREREGGRKWGAEREREADTRSGGGENVKKRSKRQGNPSDRDTVYIWSRVVKTK